MSYWSYLLVLHKLFTSFFIDLLGQTPLETRLAEIKFAVSNGAQEIDIVLSRSHVLQARWEDVYKEGKAAREACGDAHLKTILAVG